jgi:hypothetical protein
MPCKSPEVSLQTSIYVEAVSDGQKRIWNLGHLVLFLGLHTPQADLPVVESDFICGELATLRTPVAYYLPALMPWLLASWLPWLFILTSQS